MRVDIWLYPSISGDQRVRPVITVVLYSEDTQILSRNFHCLTLYIQSPYPCCTWATILPYLILINILYCVIRNSWLAYKCAVLTYLQVFFFALGVEVGDFTWEQILRLCFSNPMNKTCMRWFGIGRPPHTLAQCYNRIWLIFDAGPTFKQHSLSVFCLPWSRSYLTMCLNMPLQVACQCCLLYTHVSPIVTNVPKRRPIMKRIYRLQS